jgi:hypothetical protein
MPFWPKSSYFGKFIKKYLGRYTISPSIFFKKISSKSEKFMLKEHSAKVT